MIWLIAHTHFIEVIFQVSLSWFLYRLNAVHFTQQCESSEGCLLVYVVSAANES